MNLFWANPISNHPKAIIGADTKIIVFLPYFPDRIPPVVHVNTPIISVTSIVEFSSYIYNMAHVMLKVQQHH